MTHLTVNSPGSHSAPLSQSARERLESQLSRHKALRLTLILALFLVFALPFVAISIRVGTHLMTAWWFESLHCTVAWEVQETNWREGGTTSVSYASRNSWNAKLDDDDLDHLKKLLPVVKLELAECNTITITGLAKLRGLTSLNELNLARLNGYRYARYGVTSTPLTDACLIHLQALPRLEKLTLAGNLITDTGLSQIASMANLKSLDLEATEVSDAGLVHLEGMKNLKQVYLGATRVTKDGLAKLQMARPDLTIELDVEPAVEQGVKLRRGVTP
jgi:hypothetical protein